MATSPTVLKIKTETLIDDCFNWLSSSGENPSIKLSDLKTSLIDSQAKVLDVPLELLQSGDFGIKFPEKIDVPLPASFKNVNFIFKNKIIILFGSAALALVALFVFVILKTGGFGYMLHSFGEVLFWTGLVGAILFGSFWGFFVAGGSIAHGVTGALKIPSQEVDYLYGLISSIITSYTILAEIFCGSIIAIGLLSWIISKFLIKKPSAEDTSLPTTVQKEANA